MNLFSYIDKYGNRTFDEVSFNEIDNIILSMLSYLNLQGIVSSNFFNKRSIKDVSEEFFKIHNKKEKNITAIKNAIKILKNIKDVNRYKDLLLYNYVYETNSDSQFGALTIEINNNLIYVSFEGTDHLIGGWKEDFMLSYMFPVMSQKRAINYVNKNFFFGRKKIILGGHSKGGNLAMVAGMYAIFLVRKKIISIYNNDGPGLLNEQFNSNNYKKIEDNLIWIVANYSVIGILMRHSEDIKVVRSFKKSMFSHDPTTWVVKDLEFEKTSLSSFCEMFDKRLLEWGVKYDKKQRKKFVQGLFDVFTRAKIDSLIDIIHNKKLILKLISESNDLDSSSKIILKELIFLILECFRDVSIDELKVFFNRKN